MPVSVSSADIVQAQIPRWLGEALAYQRHVEGSLEPLIQAALARCWLEAHPMPVELAAAEADDGPLPVVWPRVQCFDPHPNDWVYRLWADDRREPPEAQEAPPPQAPQLSNIWIEEVPHAVPDPEISAELLRMMADRNREAWQSYYDGIFGVQRPPEPPWSEPLPPPPSPTVVDEMEAGVIQTQPQAHHWYSFWAFRRVMMAELQRMGCFQEPPPRPESWVSDERTREQLLRNLWPSGVGTPLLVPRLEGDNTALVEAVLRETGGHDLTGMRLEDVEALLDKVLEPEREARQAETPAEP